MNDDNSTSSNLIEREDRTLNLIGREDGSSILIGLNADDGDWGSPPCSQISVDCELPWKLNNILPLLGYRNISYKILHLDAEQWLNVSNPGSLPRILQRREIDMVASSYFSLTAERMKIMQFTEPAHYFSFNIYVQKPLPRPPDIPYYFLINPYAPATWLMLLAVFLLLMTQSMIAQRVNQRFAQNGNGDSSKSVFRSNQRQRTMLTLYITRFVLVVFTTAAFGFYSAKLAALSIRAVETPFPICGLRSLAQQIRLTRFTLLATSNDIVNELLEMDTNPTSRLMREALAVNPATVVENASDYCRMLAESTGDKPFAMISSDGNMFQFCKNYTCNLLRIPLTAWPHQVAAFLVSPHSQRLLHNLNRAIFSTVWDHENRQFQAKLVRDQNNQFCNMPEISSCASKKLQGHGINTASSATVLSSRGFRNELISFRVFHAVFIVFGSIALIIGTLILLLEIGLFRGYIDGLPGGQRVLRWVGRGFYDVVSNTCTRPLEPL